MTREEAVKIIEVAKAEVEWNYPMDYQVAFDMAIEVLQQPERPTGRWIYGEHDVAMCDGYRCDKCGFFVAWDYQHKGLDFIKDYHFCPNCGAKMEVEYD